MAIFNSKLLVHQRVPIQLGMESRIYEESEKKMWSPWFRDFEPYQMLISTSNQFTHPGKLEESTQQKKIWQTPAQ